MPRISLLRRALALSRNIVTIKVAEAAKVIENTQRDLNIALMNELALIFHRLGVGASRKGKARIEK